MPAVDEYLLADLTATAELMDIWLFPNLTTVFVAASLYTEALSGCSFNPCRIEDSQLSQQVS